jgi:hypothetical protein
VTGLGLGQRRSFSTFQTVRGLGHIHCASAWPQARRNNRQGVTAEDAFKIHDKRPAAELGVTPWKAREVYRRSDMDVSRAFASTNAEGERVGQRDHYMVWWAHKRDLDAYFGPPTVQQTHVTAPVAVQRAAARLDKIREQMAERRAA